MNYTKVVGIADGAINVRLGDKIIITLKSGRPISFLTPLAGRLIGMIMTEDEEAYKVLYALNPIPVPDAQIFKVCADATTPDLCVSERQEVLPESGVDT